MCVGGILELMKKHNFGKKRFFFQFFKKSVWGLIDLGKPTMSFKIVKIITTGAKEQKYKFSFYSYGG
jgi:hypothetical protein